MSNLKVCNAHAEDSDCIAEEMDAWIGGVNEAIPIFIMLS